MGGHLDEGRAGRDGARWEAGRGRGGAGRGGRGRGGVERGKADPGRERRVELRPKRFFRPPVRVRNFRAGWRHVTFPGPIAMQGSCDWPERIRDVNGWAPAAVCRELNSQGSAPLRTRPRPHQTQPRVLLAGRVGLCHCILAGWPRVISDPFWTLHPGRGPNREGWVVVVISEDRPPSRWDVAGLGQLPLREDSSSASARG